MRRQTVLVCLSIVQRFMANRCVADSAITKHGANSTVCPEMSSSSSRKDVPPDPAAAWQGFHVLVLEGATHLRNSRCDRSKISLCAKPEISCAVLRNYHVLISPDCSLLKW